MIVPRQTRAEILAKLQAKIDALEPILISSAGSGLVASLLEKAGADCVNTFENAAWDPPIEWRATSPIFPKPSSRCSRRRALVPFGLRAHRVSDPAA